MLLCVLFDLLPEYLVTEQDQVHDHEQQYQRGEVNHHKHMRKR